MKKFIGRISETKQLRKEFQKDGKSLVAVIGRRGVGKTTFINNFVLNEIDNADYLILKIEGKKNKPLKQQIKDIFFYVSRILKYTKEDVDFFNKNISWFSFFTLLSEYCNRKKVLIIIDEFAWLHTKCSNFVEEFGGFYNAVILSQTKIIISASAISWMNKNVIQNKGSMFHKISLLINLKSFSIKETFEYLKVNGFNINSDVMFKYYMITGGVVRYLEKLKPEQTFEENAVEIFKNNNNSTGLEFEELFKQTFSSNTNAHQKIVDCFHKQNSHSISSIQKETSLSFTTISTILEELVVSDILSIKSNYKNKKRENIYFITDLFCLSHLKLVKNKILCQNIFNNQSFNINKGFILEIIVLKNIDLIKKEIGRSGFESIEYSLRNKDNQIDLIIEYSKNKYSIIEVKFYHVPFVLDEEYQKELMKKKDSFEKFLISKKIKDFDIDFIIFSMNGVKKTDTVFGFNYHEINFDKILKTFI